MGTLQTSLPSRASSGSLLVWSRRSALAGAWPSAQDKVVRIGFQKYGKLVLLKSKGTLEKKLKPLGYKVEWTEFPSGPPLLEALNVGAIDFGNTGEAPPIFAQAAGAPLVYVAHEPPAPKGEAILVPKDSPIKTVADLKGKKVALNKGSNVHYLLVKALEKAGVKYSEIEPVFLAPADARAAFERGSVDAWVIWDPFQAAAEAATRRAHARRRHRRRRQPSILSRRRGISSRRIRRSSTRCSTELGEVDDWAKGDIKAVAAAAQPVGRHAGAVLEVALKRQTYGIKPLDRRGGRASSRASPTPSSQLGLLPKNDHHLRSQRAEAGS